MSSVNKAILVGNLGKDPEVRSTQSGGKVVSFSVATSERWKDRQSGDQRERTEWHTVVVFTEGLASVAERYLRKGSKVYVEGKIQTRKWQDREGKDRWSTEIVLNGFDAKLVLLDRQQADPGRHDYSGHDDGRWSGDRPGGGSGGTAGGGGSASTRPFDSDLDDDVPF